MSWYRTVWPLIARIDPETTHNLTLSLLSSGLFTRTPRPDDPVLQSTLWGRSFPNPVGLAAGLDKNAHAPGAFLGFGFGFVEVGTVTPRAQPGNPLPRLFRLPEDRAIINRMGFNNAGMEAMAARFARHRPKGLIGINLGKNKETEDAACDYERGIECLAPFADYLVMNVSSPNTPGLRTLQGRAPLEALLGRARSALDRTAKTHRPPLLLKIAPDLTPEDLADIAQAALGDGATPLLDGLICTNTTIARPATLKARAKGETGGLSGAPLKIPATEILRRMYALTQGRVPLIGVGGISSGEEAYARIRAGASLVQIYSALIYEGPGLVGRIKTDLARLLKADGFTRLEQAIGVAA